MAIKHNPKTGLWSVSYSKRPRNGGDPVTARRKNLKSKAEANRVFAELVVQVENKLKAEIVPTWRSVTEDYIEANRGVNWTEKTAENYGLNLRAHTYPIWEGKSVDEINTGDVKELLNGKLSAHSPSHRKSMLKFINGVFNFALERGYIQRNPVPKMKFQIGSKLEKVLTNDEAKRLLEMAKRMNVEWYYVWALALYLGLRNGELYALTWDAVNFENRQIMICKSWNNKDGFKDYTKSREDRIVEIAPKLLPILKELKRKQHDSIYVLPRIDKWDKGEQARELRMFLAGMGLPQIRFHDLRATWATAMLSNGVEAIRVMIMGGWKDLKTMQRYIRKAGVNIKGITEGLEF